MQNSVRFDLPKDLVNYYKSHFVCHNCDYDNHCYIPKGTKRLDIRITCLYCGCIIQGPERKQSRWQWDG